MNAAEIAGRLGLRQARDGWRGNCPVCGYADTFAVREGRTRTLIACASCDDRSALVNFLAKCGGGTWEARPPAKREGDHAARTAKIERANKLWDSAQPVAGSIAERYLAVRGIEHLAGSEALRFAPKTSHPGGGPGLPAMVALIHNADGERIACHRTYLRPDGSGKADVDPPKASLGPVWGGLIWLEEPNAVAGIIVGEGIESSASAGRLIGLPAVSAVSAGNLGAGVILPAAIRHVTIAADGDVQGETRALQAADRWQREGRAVRIARPHATDDWNDLVLAERRNG